MGADGGSEKGRGAHPQLLRAAVTLAALALAVVHAVWPAIKVDAVTGAFLVVALLPWLAPVVKSLELPGGIKVELQELKQQALEARGAAESATRQAELALAATTTAEAQRTGGGAQDDVAALAREYARIRATQAASPRRTAEMTAVVGRMIALAPGLSGFDVKTALLGDDRGTRLAGYAYLYARPDPGALEPLVHAITELEDKPFGQYWGLRALGAVVAVAGGSLPDAVRAKLERYRRRIDRGTDRDYELGKILALDARQ